MYAYSTRHEQAAPPKEVLFEHSANLNSSEFKIFDLLSFDYHRHTKDIFYEECGHYLYTLSTNRDLKSRKW